MLASTSPTHLYPAFPDRSSSALNPTPHASPTFTCCSGLYTLIPLLGEYGDGSFAKVSLEDHFYLSMFDWYLTKAGYATTKGINGFARCSFPMHRVVAERMGLILDLEDTELIDHRNRDRTDNQRVNLRVATIQQNAFNSEKPLGSTGYIGVRRSGLTRFGVCVSTGEGRNVTLGSYRTAREAAMVRDALARFYHGDFAVTNFPGSEAYGIEEARQRKRVEKC